MSESFKSVLVAFETSFFYGMIFIMPIFAFVCLVNRLRIRNILFTVNTGRAFGYPLMPTLYALLQLACIAVSIFTSDSEAFLKFCVYLVASGFWFIGAYISNQKIVTTDGILMSINSPRKSFMKWASILDYFSIPKKNMVEYNFFVNSLRRNKVGGADIVRSKLTVRVPNANKERFQKVIKEKLESRFEVDPMKIFKSEFK
jgi:hypothetical protein